MHNEPLYTGKFSRMDIFIDFKMIYFVGEFVKTEYLNLDDSVESLDELKAGCWLILVTSINLWQSKDGMTQ